MLLNDKCKIIQQQMMLNQDSKEHHSMQLFDIPMYGLTVKGVLTEESSLFYRRIQLTYLHPCRLDHMMLYLGS